MSQKEEIKGSFKDYVPSKTVELIHMQDGAGVALVGKLSTLLLVPTKSGQQLGFGVFNDEHGEVDIVIFPEVIDRYKELGPDVEIRLEGILDISEGDSTCHVIVGC